MKNRTILVTGGNRGIGRAIVEGLAQDHSDTILMGCRDLKKGLVLAEKLGSSVKAVHLDLSSREMLQNHLSDILARHPQIDVLINNAGIYLGGSFLDIPLKDFEQTLQVNSFAPYELIRAITPSMIQNNYGRIVNMSSGYGSLDDGLTGPFAYSISKTLLNALTLSISNSLPPTVKINAMCPGWVQTRMGGESAPRSPEKGAETAIWLTNLGEDGPSGGFFRDKQQIEW